MTTATATKTEVSASVVRAWAKARGLTVGERGHLPQSVIDAYNKAHRSKCFRSKNPSRKAA